MDQVCWLFFFFNDTATTEIYTLSLHDALPILVALARTPALRSGRVGRIAGGGAVVGMILLALLELFAITAANESTNSGRSEEHTSELQSPQYLVCRLLLATKKS